MLFKYNFIVSQIDEIYMSQSRARVLIFLSVIIHVVVFPDACFVICQATQFFAFVLRGPFSSLFSIGPFEVFFFHPVNFYQYHPAFSPSDISNSVKCL